MSTAFVFPGQGTQWPRMGRDLAAVNPAFAERLEDCDAALRPLTGWSVHDALDGRDFERADVVQPVLWAVMVALAGAWEAAGVHPDVVVGHSQGELAAACVAGALTLQDGARAVTLRSRAVADGLGPGAMACLALTEDETAGLIKAWGGRLTIAAVNGTRTVVVTGPRAEIESLCTCARADGIGATVIEVSYAGHSAAVDAIEDRILSDLAPLRPLEPAVPIHSTVTGRPLAAGELDAGYCYRNLREPVRLAPVLSALVEDGVDVFVEVGPHPVLSSAIRETVGELGRLTVGTLHRSGGPDCFHTALAEIRAFTGVRAAAGRRAPLAVAA